MLRPFFAAADWIAATTSGRAMAMNHGPKAPYIVNKLSIGSIIKVAPWAPVNKSGSPPTDWKARTGEFTPPGIRVCAVSNSVDMRSGSFLQILAFLSTFCI